MKDVMKVWPFILNKIETKNVEETYFFNFKDKEGEACALEIKHGKCQFIDKKPDNYTIMITTETNDLIAILSKKKTIEEAIREDKLTVNGDDKKLENFGRYFSGDPLGTQVTINNYSITENEKGLLEGKWSKPRKVLGLIATPRKDRGATAIVYSFFKQGLDECDCEIDTIYLADLENNFCKGCFTCWHSKDKKCVHNDDVNNLILNLHTYDLMVLAAPVYVDGLPGMFKNFVDRMLCLLDPEFILKDDHCRHPIRFPKMPHLVLLSTCGFTEMDNFSPMIEHVKEICKNMHLTYVGEILPPTAWMMSIPNLQILYEPIFEAIKQAGKDIVTSGKISEELSNQITTPIFSRGQIFAIHNRIE
ncbi:MAG TPA: flavodoxin family protein [candidate division Zixibacteria bacterium]|nr:flavodoxin family protein [candidate division Zixibacteria bacterium]